MNIAAIARDSDLLADAAAPRTTLELAGNDLLVETRELRSGGPNGRVASFAKYAQERQVVATPHKSVRLWNSANVSELDRNEPPSFEKGQRSLSPIGNATIIELQRAPVNAFQLLIKRTIDIFLACTASMMLLPLLALVAIAIKLDSPGPVIFRQTRHGLNRRPFRILKFRTMTVLEDGQSVKQAERFDKRVTRLGSWLRRTSIDELPQLINVLKGEMSIVGPRPHAAAHDIHFNEVIANYTFRQRVKPGITGYAQVNGSRGETPTVEAMQRRVALDIWYIDNWSFQLDLAIMFRTMIEIVHGRNAY
jgi:putative colanic acid biosynthesis UDP-glucose lipid carrier transferase